MPKPLNSRCQELVSSLISYFEQERDNGGPLLPLNCVRERVSAALKISVCSVSRISQKVKGDVVLKSPKKIRPHVKRVTNQDHLDIGSIRNQIYELYERKKTVTLESIHQKLENMKLFGGCKSSLRTLLQDIGFKWSKDNPRRGLMELPDIAFKRIQFLRTYQQIKEESTFDFVYLDETWIFQNGTLGHSWQDDNRKSVKTTKVDGKRHIVLHAGNKNGFIPGAELVFSSKSKGDYHGEMNQNNFLVWFENQLLKNLEEPSVIVMDNASYHSTLVDKAPTSGSTKPNIKEWLTKHNLQFESTMLKGELLQIVNQNKPEKKFLTDQMAEQYGHRVLRLPPYHCIFNPIELIWGVAKNYYNQHIGRDGNTNDNCLDMWKEALSTITPVVWMNSIRHTEQVIEKWWNRERMFDRMEVNNLVIDLNDDSDSDSDF